MKTVIKIFIMMTLMSTTPFEDSTLVKEYSSINELAVGLEEETVYNFTRTVGTFEDFEVVMDKPYVDAHLSTLEYGVIPLEDTLLRYIVIFKRYYNLDYELILEMICIENLKEINVCVAPPTNVAVAEIRHRIQWAYRLRAFGVPQSKIIQQYKDLPEGFFE